MRTIHATALVSSGPYSASPRERDPQRLIDAHRLHDDPHLYRPRRATSLGVKPDPPEWGRSTSPCRYVLICIDLYWFVLICIDLYWFVLILGRYDVRVCTCTASSTHMSTVCTFSVVEDKCSIRTGRRRAVHRTGYVHTHSGRAQMARESALSTSQHSVVVTTQELWGRSISLPSRSCKAPLPPILHLVVSTAWGQSDLRWLKGFQFRPRPKSRHQSASLLLSRQLVIFGQYLGVNPNKIEIEFELMDKPRHVASDAENGESLAWGFID